MLSGVPYAFPNLGNVIVPFEVSTFCLSLVCLSVSLSA